MSSVGHFDNVVIDVIDMGPCEFELYCCSLQLSVIC